ncbi:oocyte zinc finger protein XlCOF6-like [Euwallacea fornicatus]|uniref:oocyte zinc finger protein XlCOF6-like n=1 Tax=Euwallacea fornicatus TaxID=995702 RepID=UPI00338E1C0E
MAASNVYSGDILMEIDSNPDPNPNTILSFDDTNIVIKNDFSDGLEINLSVKCRGCFVEDQEMHYLFTAFDQQLSLADILFRTTSVVCKEGDGFPPYLCTRCTICVIDFFNFKIQYQKTDLYVQTLLGKTIKGEKDFGEVTKLQSDLHRGLNDESDNVGTVKDDSIGSEAEESFDADEEKRLLMPKVNGLTVISPQYCNECNQSFEIGTDYETHSAKEHGVNPFTKFHTFRTLVIENDKAMAVARKKKKLEASASRKISAFKEFLSNDGKFCRICRRMIPEEDFKEHWETHKVHICEECGYRCIKKCDLNSHMLSIHNNERNFVCSLCGKSYKTKQLLRRHHVVHLNLRLHSCDICGNRFNDSSTLKTHIQLRHIRSRNFVCPICGLAYPMKATLDKHILRHNKNRPPRFFCEDCENPFRDRSSLKRHYLVKHTNAFVRPACSFCDKSYCSTTKLRYHVERHHSGKPVERKKRGRKRVTEDDIEEFLSSDSCESDSKDSETEEQDREPKLENGDDEDSCKNSEGINDQQVQTQKKYYLYKNKEPADSISEGTETSGDSE